MPQPAQADSEVLRLLEVIRANTNNPKVLDATYSIEVLSASGPTQIMGLEYGLTPKQSAFLTHLARRPCMVYSREAVLNALWYTSDQQPSAKLLDVVVKNIRDKLKKGNAPYWIETVWGQGWRYVNTPAATGKLYYRYARPKKAA